MEIEDPRKLRPGEIDPNPETKPARPDQSIWMKLVSKSETFYNCYFLFY